MPKNHKVPVYVLTLCTSEIEILEKRITKKLFENYVSNGMPYSDYEDFQDSTEFNQPIFDELTNLSIDDKEIDNFDQLFRTKYDLAIQDYGKKHLSSPKVKTTKVDYAVVGEKWVKRSWYKLTIYEEFDFSKLIIHISRQDYFGRNDCRDGFSLSYGDKEFEFIENHGSNSESESLMTSKGKSKNFDVLEEDDDDE